MRTVDDMAHAWHRRRGLGRVHRSNGHWTGGPVLQLMMADVSGVCALLFCSMDPYQRLEPSESHTGHLPYVCVYVCANIVMPTVVLTFAQSIFKGYASCIDYGWIFSYLELDIVEVLYTTNRVYKIVCCTVVAELRGRKFALGIAFTLCCSSKMRCSELCVKLMAQFR